MFFICRPVSVAAVYYFLPSIHTHVYVFVFCITETGHQLDWTDEPVRYPRAEVSLCDRAQCILVWLHQSICPETGLGCSLISNVNVPTFGIEWYILEDSIISEFLFTDRSVWSHPAVYFSS